MKDKSVSEVDSTMTLKETLRLIDWLRAHGFTQKQIDKCLKYIANLK